MEPESMIGKMDAIRAELTSNPEVTDAELMDKFGITEVLAIAAAAFILAVKEETNEAELLRLFPEFVAVKQRYNFKNWVVNGLRSIWKLGR